jgi:hypothetical protein
MNDDEIRDALRADEHIVPLDPAKVIAGARRRRRTRNLTTGGLAAVAVLAIATGGIITANGLNGSPAVDPPLGGTPTAVPSARTTGTPGAVASSANPGENVLARCQAALSGAEPRPGPKATQQAILPGADGAVVVIADSLYWAACDSGYNGNGVVEVSARRPAGLATPSTSDTDAFAVANSRVTKAGKDYEYYWAAGRLPAGVKTVRYGFPDGRTLDAVVTGKYWLMHYWSPSTANDGAGGSTPVQPAKIRVRLLAANGSVVNDFRLEWGAQTCAQISHGC